MVMDITSALLCCNEDIASFFVARVLGTTEFRSRDSAWLYLNRATQYFASSKHTIDGL